MLLIRLVMGLFLFLIQGNLIAAEREATPASSIRMKPGFQVELLRSAQPGEGSWISLTFDDQGRIILGEETAGLLRLTIGSNAEETTVDRLAGMEMLKECRGVLYAHQSLYVCATKGGGIFRLKDTNKDGVYEDVQLICPLDYKTRYGHGANQLRLGPDGMIYAVVGNDVRFPENRDPLSPYKNPQNDWLLPNPRDGDQDERVGYILKMGPAGEKVTVLAGGLRNQVDVDFNGEGEMFTWDADMEWDLGLPWYRPTRINHIVSAGEYGWRFGTGKWPAWFPDSLPSNFDTGLGSPTGITFGTNSRWPEKYRQMLYAADWQNGRLLLIDLKEKGASYEGSSEVMAEGSPLNICDLEFGPDGALYFVTGGRGSQSGLYRITMSPEAMSNPTETGMTKSAAAAAARKIRHELESLHVREDHSQLAFIWSHLGSDDPWIRFAARLALENQPVHTWRSRVETEPDSKARHTALMALARVGEPADQSIILKGILACDLAAAEQDELLWVLRALQLTLIRQGTPEPADYSALAHHLHQVPASDRFDLNWLLSELLVALNTPTAVERVISKFSDAETQEEHIQYAKTLLRAKEGWTPESREVLLQWLTLNKRLPGGRLVNPVLLAMREDFELSLTDEERRRFQQELQLMQAPAKDVDDSVTQTPRPFVRNWTLEELDSELAARNTKPHSAESGRKLLSEALCLRCHQFEGRGSHIGPNLSAVGKRMDRRALLESIINPSKEIDPKYSNSIYELENGQVVAGRVTMVSRNEIGVETDQLTGKSTVFSRSDIVESKLSPTSPMPQGLLNNFTADEIHDLIAYLRHAEK